MKRKLLKIRVLVLVAMSVAGFLLFSMVRTHNKCHVVPEGEITIQEEQSDHRQAFANKSKPTLSVPKDIKEAVGSDEWISTTITDPNRQCPQLLKENIKNNGSDMGCQIPDLDPFHPSMMQLFKQVAMPQLECSKYKAYGKLVNGKIISNDTNVVSATYKRIVRQGDFKFILGKSVPIPTTEKITDEFIEVDYLLKNGQHAKEIFLQPVPHEHLLKRSGQKKPGIPLNILIVGIDSLSHANARRKLPKAYEYLKKKLGAFIFNGHSIVGDGTTEQLAAMLTGLGELEQYESRRHHKNPRPVDGWTWIYKQLKEHGYLTGYSGDDTIDGPFQYRLMGFTDPPTDFYTRPFYQMARNFLKGRGRCLASRTISKYQFDYIREVFQTFPEKLKFFFSFNVYYSHNSNNEAAMIEPDLLSLIRDLKQTGHLNNTLLIIMGDHGTRYGKARELLQGKLEERLPLFAMSFPSWFSSRYPKIVENLRTNTDRLTSWYDVYATYRHMLSYPEVPSDLKHGKSLFLEIPKSRTCADATVDQHWCPCLQWSAVNMDHSHVQNAALAAVEYMNSANQEHKSSAEMCEILSLKSINYALLEKPNEKLLSFKETKDLLPAFDDKSRPAQKDFCRYQIQFVTSPNNGVYEATVRYFKEWFMVSKSISRVNKYGDQPECIARQLPHLRKFCLCRKANYRKVNYRKQQKRYYLNIFGCS